MLYNNVKFLTSSQSYDGSSSCILCKIIQPCSLCMIYKTVVIIWYMLQFICKSVL